MAVGVLIPMPGVERKQYEDVTAEIFGHYPMKVSEIPEGMLLHTAGPNDGGWYVFDVWETIERFRSFGEEQLEPAVRAVMGTGLDHRPQIFEVETLVQPH